MTLRLPEKLDRELDRLAVERQVSKNSLVIEAVRQHIERSLRQSVVEEGFQFALSHDREALERLADA